MIRLCIRTVNNNKVGSAWVARGYLGTESGPWFCCFRTDVLTLL
jgi:hypothetical protein